MMSSSRYPLQPSHQDLSLDHGPILPTPEKEIVYLYDELLGPQLERVFLHLRAMRLSFSFSFHLVIHRMYNITQPCRSLDSADSLQAATLLYQRAMQHSLTCQNASPWK